MSERGFDGNGRRAYVLAARCSWVAECLVCKTTIARSLLTGIYSTTCCFSKKDGVRRQEKDFK